MKPSLLPLAAWALALGRQNRATMHPDGVRWESDTDHSVMLAIVACSIASAHPELGLDIGLIAQLSVVHDMPEAVTGDVDTFDAAMRGLDVSSKADKERAAREHIAADTAAWPWLGELMALYEAQQIPEARFVRYVDKILPRLTNALNGGAAIRARRKDRETAFRWDRQLIAGLAEQYPEFAHVLGELLNTACDEAEERWSDG